ncbi:MAG: hypothetical protein JJE51_01720 [Thermoanaerobaculia bacterium]|nr:hypothetical protein [Thermoanaerobaculia bacterium]
MRRLLVAVVLVCLSFTATAAPAGAEIRNEKWREDLAYARRLLPRVHINLFHDLSQREFDKLFTDLDRDVPRLADHEIIVRLAAIVARFGPRDGHSRVNLFAPAAGFSRLPINLYQFSDGLFVRAIQKEHAGLEGARVIAIGGVEAERAIERVSEITPADNEWTRKAWSMDLVSIPEVLHALKITTGDVKAPVPFELELPDGKRRIVAIAPVASLESVEWIDLRFRTGTAPLYLRHASRDPFDRHGAAKNHWFEYLPEHSLLYVNYSGVVDDKDESVARFSESLFEFADRNVVKKIVFDVRQNSGGNNYLNRPIFYEMMKRRDTLGRRGSLFVIIGRVTYSAAQNFVNFFDNHFETIFVGEPTGASPNHYGDPLRIELPNSRIPIAASSVWWQDLDPRDSRMWIEPHVAAELDSRSTAEGRDPALEAIIDYKQAPSVAEVVRAAMAKGPAEAEQAMRAWHAEPRNKYQRSDGALNRFAVSLYGENRPADALAVFELNAKVNPRSWLAHNSLARGYASVGRKPEAIAEYESAIAIDPRAALSITGLERLRNPSPPDAKPSPPH